MWYGCIRLQAELTVNLSSIFPITSLASSISSKTNYLLGGSNIGPSKLLKIKKLEIPIISENDLIEMINLKL